ncbi:MAG TPA: hypothetical protein VIG24_01645, partial [Acidimicrobiia bacterium]
MTEESRCMMLARTHDETARSIRSEADLTTDPWMRDLALDAAEAVQRLALAYVQAAEEARR